MGIIIRTGNNLVNLSDEMLSPDLINIIGHNVVSPFSEESYVKLVTFKRTNEFFRDLQ